MGSGFFVFEVFLGLGESLVHFPFSDSDFHEVRAHTFNFYTLGLDSHSDDCKILYAYQFPLWKKKGEEGGGGGGGGGGAQPMLCRCFQY